MRKIIESLSTIGYIGNIVAGLSETIFMPFPMEVVYIPIALAITSIRYIPQGILIYLYERALCIDSPNFNSNYTLQNKLHYEFNLHVLQ